MTTTTTTPTAPAYTQWLDQAITTTVDGFLLRDALQWVLPACGKVTGGSPPQFRFVQFTIGPAHGHPDHGDGAANAGPDGLCLTLAATDRFRLHYATLPVLSTSAPGVAPGADWDCRFLRVDGKDVGDAAKGWPKPRSGAMLVDIDTATSQSAMRLTGRAGLVSSEVVVPLHGDSSNGLPPGTRWHSLLKSHPESGSPVAVDPQYLAQLAKGAGKAQHLVITLHGERPARFHVPAGEAGLHRSALIMPIRLPKS